ncbi:DUF4825 domain-containing protein [Peptoniphilus sp. MSJ-1]|uniref:DUF4825 domain-containing protein n=1 Tax=Peptoniphilus ovalis TaxID=2841503 RepID=A0ABS6FDY5_9FIRM|nr:DUF4825 domain-containing protein [Peptoniphilus ovalis]MBU5668392.1 DUF4825 domain-containing protein [Peptoniphilus ovalis]
MKNKVFIILFLILISISFIACSKKEDSILDYKTDYVGDNSKVDRILDMQKYPNNVSKKAIQILSDEEPYSLNVYLDGYEGLNEDNLFNNAAITFSLIGNLKNLNYLYLTEEDYKINNFSNPKHIAEFSREEIEVKLKENNLSLEEISKDEESLNKFLNLDM